MAITQIPRDQFTIPGDARAGTMTPYFMYENVFNETQSRLQGKPVYEVKPLVEIRFASDPQYRPKFGVDEQCEVDENGRVITWAERYSKQWQAFQDGSAQEAEGTPLEELLPFGISQAQLSLCRASAIYSVEALAHLEGKALKRLGVMGNELKPMAKRYMDSRRDGSAAQNEINELKRQLAEMRSGLAIPAASPFVDGVEILGTEDAEDAEEEETDRYEGLTDADLKDRIAMLNDGKRPLGNPSTVTLKQMLGALEGAEA